MRRSALLGLMVTDIEGEEMGEVIDTWPFDGGGEPELALVRMGRLSGRRMVPVAELLPFAGTLRLPYLRYQVEDSPVVGEDWHTLADDPYRALSYWRWEEPVDSLTARCLNSSGSFAMAKRFPTSPSPTPIAS